MLSKLEPRSRAEAAAYAARNLERDFATDWGFLPTSHRRGAGMLARIGSFRDILRQEVVEVLVQIVRYRSRLTDEDEIEGPRSTWRSQGSCRSTNGGFPRPASTAGLSLGLEGVLPGVPRVRVARTIPDAYRVDWPPHVELADVSKVLHPRCATHA